MSRGVAFLVVAVLLCIILSSQAADVLQCTGRRMSDGLFFFNAHYEVKEDIRDCETQWLVDEKLAGLSDAEGNKCMPPIVNATANTAILQTCPEKIECLLICPTGNIYEKQQCSCDAATPPTTPPEGNEGYIRNRDVSGDAATPPTTPPEVGFPNWGIGVLIGAIAFVVIVTATIVLCQKRQRREYSSGSADDDNL